LNSKLEVKEDSLPRLPIINPEVGTLVHIEVSKKLLRGLIVAAKDNKFKVQLVDYGRIVVTFIPKTKYMLKLIETIADFQPRWPECPA